jgi:glycine cleavage system aminomethyltransferase T
MPEKSMQVYSFFDFVKTLYPDAIINSDEKDISVFSSVKEEYSSLFSGVGMRYYSDFSLFELSGNDVPDFLHRISTNNIKNMAPLSMLSTLFLNEKGKILDRTYLYRIGGTALLLGNGVNRKKLGVWLCRYIVSEDVKITDASDSYSVFEFYGRQAKSFLILLYGNIIDALPDAMVAVMPVDSLGFETVIGRDDEFGVTKYRLIVKKEYAGELIEYLYDHHSVFNFCLVGSEAFNRFRIEKGIPSSPDEINDLKTPFECGLEKDLCFSKGSFIGHDAIARMKQ